MIDARPILLIGFMASGKSTVGRLVAERSRRRFVDLDVWIEDDAKMTIPEIFRREGEDGFRLRESRALAAALGLHDVVVATGGGAACRDDNLSDMLLRGFVVALSVAPEEVLRRVGADAGRPLLVGAADPLGRARELLAAREPFYTRAHLRIDTVGRSPESIAEEIVAEMTVGGWTSSAPRQGDRIS